MAEILDSSNVFDYFELLCTKNKLLLHTANAPKFARDADELGELSQAKLDMNLPFVVMDDISNRLVDKKSNNRLCSKNIRFFILQNVKPNDYDARQQVYLETEKILWQFVSKWYKDMYDFVAPMQYFQPETMTWASVWLPEYENCYGTEVGLTLLVPAEADIVYDEDEWLA